MKRSSIISLFVFITVLLITGCESKNSSGAFDVKGMQKTIDEKNSAFGISFASGDSAGMVNNYTRDGKIFPPNSDAVIGRAGIASLVSEYLKFGIKEFKDETTALYGNEDNLIEEGKYFMGDGKGNTIDKGKYICIWRKVDGDWKAYSDIFNTSLSAPAAK